MTARLEDALTLDLEAKASELSHALREAVLLRLRRRGLVVAVSGGIDSACVAALGARALGRERVFALLLPERDSSPESLAYGKVLCEKLGISYEVRDIAPILEAAGCYQARNAAVREVVPEFKPDMPWKIVLASDPLSSETLPFFRVVVRVREGEERHYRLPPRAYMQIFAATNFKQRTRKMLEYYHADRLNYAVGGTPNRLEYDQGFFVKLGDGAADVKPIASLYKSQVYALARHLGVIEEILTREPTTETYGLEQSQEEFYYSLHYSKLDLLLWAKNHGVSVESVAAHLGYTPQQVRRVHDDIDQKRRATVYLHAPPLLLERVDELERVDKLSTIAAATCPSPDPAGGLRAARGETTRTAL
jgi:NAD+ synthase